jgi:hypothetical protein
MKAPICTTSSAGAVGEQPPSRTSSTGRPTMMNRSTERGRAAAGDLDADNNAIARRRGLTAGHGCSAALRPR